MNRFDAWLQDSGAAHGPSGAREPTWVIDLSLAAKRGHRMVQASRDGRRTLMCDNCGAAARSAELGTDCKAIGGPR